MPKFDAENAVEALEWDFSKYRPKADRRKWAGVIPEPTQEAAQQFEQALRKLAPAGDVSQLEQVDTATGLPALAAALAVLCDGHPAEDQLRRLPFRVLVAFAGWLFGQLAVPLSPTAGTAG